MVVIRERQAERLERRGNVSILTYSMGDRKSGYAGAFDGGFAGERALLPRPLSLLAKASFSLPQGAREILVEDRIGQVAGPRYLS